MCGIICVGGIDMGGAIPAAAASGQTVYFQVMRATDAEMANGAGLESYNEAHWGNYVIASPEQTGSGRYVMTVPGYLPAGRYYALPFIQIGGSPAAGDTPIDILQFDWDGGNIVGVTAPLNMGQINGSALAAANLSASAGIMKTGAAAAGTLTTTQMTTGLTDTVPNIYAGRLLLFTSGVNKGLACLITAYAVTGGKLTFISYGNLPAPAAPSIGDTFVIV